MKSRNCRSWLVDCGVTRSAGSGSRGGRSGLCPRFTVHNVRLVPLTAVTCNSSDPM